jgi:hypothetical protein
MHSATECNDERVRSTAEWLAAHDWVWRRRRLEELLAAGGDLLFVCGIGTNQAELFDLFAVVFLLRIDEKTQEDRLVAHDRAGPPGRSEAGRQQIREGRPVFEAQMIQAGAVPLDGSPPAPAVVDSLLGYLDI